MEEKQLFQIGEVAKMFRVSMGTLRHYENRGLLKPEYTDPETGYRYYGVRQLEVLNTIRYLRVLDFPLSQIADFLGNRDVFVIEEKLEKQKKIIEEKQRELAVIAKKIDHRLEMLRDAAHSSLDEIRICEVPGSRVRMIHDSLKLDSYLDLEYAIRKLDENQKEPLIFLGKVGVGISKEKLLCGEYGCYDQVFLVLDDEDDYEGETEQIPARRCALVRFRGSHREAPGYYEKLTAYIRENGLMIDGASQEITLIDDGLTSDAEKFVTEIRIPVREENVAAGHSAANEVDIGT